MGLPFHQLDQQTLIGIVVEGLRARNGGWITPVNLDVLCQFTEDHESREIRSQPSGCRWAAHSLGLTPFRYARAGKGRWQRSRPEPAEAAAQAGVSVFLLGGNPGVAAAAAGRLRARYPGLQGVESYCPPFGFEDDPEGLDRIREALRGAPPALVLVGLGSCYGMATRRPAAAQGAGLSNTITLETKALTVRIYARPQSVASARKSSLV